MPKDFEGQILARLIIEMLGAPKEHLDKTLKDFVKMLKEDRELRIVKEDFAEPELREGMFHTFVELEVWFKDLSRLFNFCFEAMPSSVEILEPENLNISAYQLSGYLNDLQARLHLLDMALKKVEAAHSVLGKNAEALFKNLIDLSIKNSPKELGELSDDLGINPDELKPLLEEMTNAGILRLDNGKYHRGVR